MPSHDPPPHRLWLLTWGGVALIVLVTGFAAIWIAQGRTDPDAAAREVWADTVLRWAGGPVISLGADASRWFLNPADAWLPLDVFTLDVRARFAADAGAGAAWGVWIETTDGARLLFAVSNEGYTSIRRCDTSPPNGPSDADDCPALRPEWRWFAYPRIRPPGESNTLTLHVERAGAIRLRINQEIMGITPAAWTGQWGVWVRGGRDTPARLTWEAAQVRE